MKEVVDEKLLFTLEELRMWSFLTNEMISSMQMLNQKHKIKASIKHEGGGRWEIIIYTWRTTNVVFLDQWDDIIYANVCVSFLISTENKK